MNLCAASQNGLNILVEERAADELDLREADAVLRWDEHPEMTTDAGVLGWDELAVIVNPSNPLAELTADELRGIYSGKIRDWSQVESLNDDLFNPIQAYSTITGDDANRVFSELFLSGDRLDSFVILVPDAAAMRQMVGSTPGAVGFLPRRWLDSSVREVSISGIDKGELRRPILIIYSNSANPILKPWSTCLAGGIQ